MCMRMIIVGKPAGPISAIGISQQVSRANKPISNSQQKQGLPVVAEKSLCELVDATCITVCIIWPALPQPVCDVKLHMPTDLEEL